MSDAKTLSYYAAHADDYMARFSRQTPDQDLHDFMAALPIGGRVLDAGCGPGNSAWLLAKHGFVPCAIDASPAMVQIAQEKFNINAQVMNLMEIDFQDEFDGVWANFSLLHLKRNQFEPALMRLKRALKPKGVLHLGLKCGNGQSRDALGRFYTYYNVKNLHELLEKLDFNLFKTRQGKMMGMGNTTEPFVIILAHA